MTDHTKLKRLAENHRIRVLDLEISDQILALIAENERLEQFRLAYMEWSDKTEWARLDSTKDEWGRHLADVIKMRVDQLKAEVEGLRKALTDIRENSDDLGACECAADALKDAAMTKEGHQ